MDNLILLPKREETALDRLARRLGEAPLSPDVRAGLEAGPEQEERR